MQTLIWKDLNEAQRRIALARPALAVRDELRRSVALILAQVRERGDAALRELTARFDGAVLDALAVSEAEFAAAEAALGREDLDALGLAYANIRRFHAAQRREPLRIETMPGVVCERLTRPIARVGLYVPGGTAPLPSTVLMLGVPAELAGCGTKILCTPPDAAGRINPWILAAARLCGISRVYKLGGAQAIAALGFGTESVPRVDKIFGPGNAFVTEAKQQLAQTPGGAAIDMPAGPSELMVIADETANPRFVAADLLSQAEHGPDSQVILVCFGTDFAGRVAVALREQLAVLPRGAVAEKALAGSRVLIAATPEEALAIANSYAPEHLILQVARPRDWLDGVDSAGSVFLGELTPESLGDYASGTNHVLPTYGYARAYSGLALGDFERTMSVQEATPEGLRALGPVVERLAAAEGLLAHRNAVSLRLAELATRTGVEA